MRFLLDHVYAVTAKFLAAEQHDVVLVAQLGLSQATEEKILRTMQELNFGHTRQGLRRSRFCESAWNWCHLSPNLANYYKVSSH